MFLECTNSLTLFKNLTLEHIQEYLNGIRRLRVYIKTTILLWLVSK